MNKRDMCRRVLCYEVHGADSDWVQFLLPVRSWAKSAGGGDNSVYFRLDKCVLCVVLCGTALCKLEVMA